MSLEVYFDNTLIDEQYYSGLNNNNELFNESFKLGATPSNKFTLNIRKEGVSIQPSTINFKNNNTIFAILKVDNIKEEEYEYVYTLTDSMLDLDFYYDASLIFVGGSTTLLNIAQDICLNGGMTLGTTNFRGYDKVISWYDNRKTAREYIGYIAELNGGYARVDNNVLYFLKHNTNSVKTINIDDCEDFKIGEYHKITRVVYEQGNTKYEYGDTTGNTLYLNSDNVFITTQSEVQAIYNDIKDFEFYSFTTDNCPIDYSIKAGEVITFSDETNNYKTIAQYDLDYFGGWYGGYSLDINTERQEESTKVIGLGNKVKNLSIIVDRDKNEIQQIVEEIGDRSQSTTTITQDINSINSRIENIADFTNEINAFDRLHLTETVEGEGYVLDFIIKGNSNIFYALTPEEDLVPSDELVPQGGDITLVIDKQNTISQDAQYFNIEIGEPLRHNGDIYDEVNIGRDGTVKIIRRINSYGNVMPEPIETVLEDKFLIPTFDNDTYLYIRDFRNVSYYCKYIIKSDFSDTFTTHLEMNSAITQKANEITSLVSANYETKEDAISQYSEFRQTTDEITLEVSKKVGNDEIISKINLSSESASINSNRISLERKNDRYDK